MTSAGNTKERNVTRKILKVILLIQSGKKNKFNYFKIQCGIEDEFKPAFRRFCGRTQITWWMLLRSMWKIEHLRSHPFGFLDKLKCLVQFQAASCCEIKLSFCSSFCDHLFYTIKLFVYSFYWQDSKFWLVKMTLSRHTFVLILVLHLIYRFDQHRK